MIHLPDPVLPLTDAEKELLAQLNQKPKDEIVAELRTLLEAAITVELATIPIYLFTYYSINRKPSFSDSVPADRADQLRVYANQAGSVIMSVAVEEMLHMSLSSNLLYAFGGVPELYLKSPGPPNGAHYPVNLPDHAQLGPDAKPLLISLGQLSYTQLWSFLEIEWPETVGAPPEGQNFDTIGQVYSYIRCLMLTDGLKDYEFGPAANQLQPDYYAPNNIDTAYAKGTFDRSAPAPRKDGKTSGAPVGIPVVPDAPQYPSGSAAASFENASDSHAGMTQLLAIDSLEKAQQAIATICDQGEGFNPQRIDGTDDLSGKEESHFYKFLSMQAALTKPAGFNEPQKGPPPPDPGIPVITDEELGYFTFPFPENPITRADGNSGGTPYTGEVEQAISDALNGLYQYMLILTETSFKVTGMAQKKLFYTGMHMSMIWIMDKLIQQMRNNALADGSGYALAPTFENYNLGDRTVAYSNLVSLATTAVNAINAYDAALPAPTPPAVAPYSGCVYYLNLFATLPDVSEQWTTQA